MFGAVNSNLNQVGSNESSDILLDDLGFHSDHELDKYVNDTHDIGIKILHEIQDSEDEDGVMQMRASKPQ